MRFGRDSDFLFNCMLHTNGCSTKETSFNTFLSSTPTIKELTEHVNVSTNWYIVGTMLDLDQRRLQDINGKPAPNTHKMIEMFNLWLDTTPTASRRQILEALRVDAMEEITLAHKYEKHLKELYEATCKLYYACML